MTARHLGRRAEGQRRNAVRAVEAAAREMAYGGAEGRRGRRAGSVRRLMAAAAMGALIAPWTAAGSQAQGFDTSEAEAIAGIRAAKTGPMSKMDPALVALHEGLQADSAVRGLRADAVPALSGGPLARVVDGKVLIDAAASGEAADLLADLQALGLERGSAFGRVVSGWLPVTALEQAAGLGSLQLARPSVAIAQAGSVTSEGDPAMFSDVAREVFEVNGRRITVGVLSDSYDCQGGAADDIETGDLPPERRITILDDTACPAPDEGRAMMQLIRDVAPRASQAFHTANKGQADFANGIVELANQAGAEIIVDDILYFTEPMFQDGVIAQAVDQVRAAGVVYFSASGNHGRNAWDSGEAGFVDSGVRGIAGPRHDFDPGPGVDDLQSFTVAPGQTRFAFNWDQPAASVSGAPGSASDLDILVYFPSGRFTGIGGRAFNIGGDPIEFFDIINNTDEPLEIAIAIELFEGPAPGFMKYVVFDPGSENTNDPPTSFPNEFATNSGSSYGHANAAGAAGVGSSFWRQTPRFGVSPPEINAASSAGGTPTLFDTEGLPVEELREQPRVTGPDGGITTFFGGRDEFGNRDPEGNNFFGTSAAAPHVAAVAALMLEANRSLTADEILRILEDTATDMDDPATPDFDVGFDFGTGFGLVDARAAVRRASPDDDDDDDDDDFTVTRR